MISYHSDGKVTVRGYSRIPLTLAFRTWLNITDKAVAAIEAATQRGIRTEHEATENELNAKRWLQACWMRNETKPAKLSERIADWKARRHLFDIAPDPSRIVRCQCCHIPLSDPVSKLLGIGPVCRMGGNRRVGLAINAQGGAR